MYHEIGECFIRDWQLVDASSLAKYADNRKIWLNLRDGFPHPYRLEDAETFILRVSKVKPKTVFAIASQSEAIGSIGLMPGKDVHRYTAELGYWLAEPFWGRGIMTRAIKSLCAYAMDELKMLRIYAEPYSNNPASARVLEKAGFIREGTLRSSVYKDGKVLNQVLYSHIGSANLKTVG